MARLTEANGGAIEGTKRNLLSQTRLFALCLVQALMLALLNISFHVYTSGVYPSLTLGTLVAISSAVLMVSALATVFVAGYLEAAKTNCSPKIDLTLTCNKFGLELRVSNNGSPIPQDIRQNIFAAGPTFRDAISTGLARAMEILWDRW